MSPLYVFYRICPFGGGNRPLCDGDKMGLVRLCLLSFVEAFQATPVHVTFLLDSCDQGFREWIEAHVPLEKTVLSFFGLGHEGSFFKQIELACRLPEEALVYLAEDDYYYLEEAGPKLAAAIGRFDFVTPYDHPDLYGPAHAAEDSHLVLQAGHHWRTQGSTCLTFGAKAGTLSQVQETLFRHGISDHPMWLHLLRGRSRFSGRAAYRLYGPVPSLATHMVSGFLAPGVNWEGRWNKTLADTGA